MQISGRRSAVLTYGFHAFPRYLNTNVGISALNYATAACPLQLVYLIIIRRNVILVAEDIVKQLRK